MEPIESLRTWRSPAPAGEVWAALTDVDRYATWWPWLERLDGDRPVVGGELSAVIRAPARYRVSYRVRFTEVEPPRRLAAVIEGDLGGTAGIDLAPEGDGTRIEFRSRLHPHRPLLRAMGVAIEPVLVHGHDRILDAGAAQFVAGTGVELREPVESSAGPGRRTATDVLRAAALAGALSGAPSTAHAVVTGDDPLAAARAAGTLLGRATLLRGVIAHAGVSLWWAGVLAAVLPRRGALARGAVLGAAIAALDLGVIARRFPAIRALAPGPQVADHVAFGLLVGATLDRSPRR